MTDDRFRELVNLYLDKEIAPEELASLRDELKLNPARQADFDERCRLHQAMGLALKPKKSGKRSRGRHPAVASRRRVHPSSRSGSGRAGRRSNPLKAPLLVLGSGAVAVFGVAALVFNPVVREVLQDEFTRTAEVVEGVADNSLERFDSKRYESARGDLVDRDTGGNSSLTAQLRLAGLGPETSPTIANLRKVELVESSASNSEISDLVRQMEMDLYERSRHSVMDGQSVISGRTEKTGFWPDGFKSSLVSY